MKNTRSSESKPSGQHDSHVPSGSECRVQFPASPGLNCRVHQNQTEVRVGDKKSVKLMNQIKYMNGNRSGHSKCILQQKQ